jgi:hypothetical protein
MVLVRSRGLLGHWRISITGHRRSTSERKLLLECQLFSTHPLPYLAGDLFPLLDLLTSAKFVETEFARLTKVL